MATRTELSPTQLNRPSRYGYRRSVVANWCELITGDRLLLVGPGTNQRHAGTVDAISVDGAIVWLILEDGGGRKLFHQTDGYQALLDPN